MTSTATDLLVCRPSHPLRPPAWAWCLAKEFRNAPDAFKRLAADESVAIACEMQTRLSNVVGQGIDAELEVLLQFGALADAYAFWVSGEPAIPPPVLPTAGGKKGYTPEVVGPNVLARAELEALILANKSPKAISKRTNLGEEAVSWYERLFYDVRDRLSRKGWICANAIGEIHQSKTAVALPALVRAYGFHTKSARIVSSIVSTFDSVMTRDALATPGDFWRKDVKGTTGVKAGIAAKLMHFAGSDSLAAIIEAHHTAIDVETRSKLNSTSVGENKYKELVEQLQGKIDWEYRGEVTSLVDQRLKSLPPAIEPDSMVEQ